MEDIQTSIDEFDDDMLRAKSYSKQSGHYSGYTCGGDYMYGRYY